MFVAIKGFQTSNIKHQTSLSGICMLLAVNTFNSQSSYGQTITLRDSSTNMPVVNLEEFVISASKFEEKKCDSMYADLQYMKDDEKVFRNWKSGEYKEGLFLKGWMPPHPTFFIKKTCYDKFGKFNTDFVSAGDYELMLRMIHKNKISVAYLPEVIVKMRVGGKSNASLMNRIKANREDRLAWKINNLKPGILTLTFKPLSKLKQFFA